MKSANDVIKKLFFKGFDWKILKHEILIANRGEIVSRIVKSREKLDIIPYGYILRQTKILFM